MSISKASMNKKGLGFQPIEIHAFKDGTQGSVEYKRTLSLDVKMSSSLAPNCVWGCCSPEMEFQLFRYVTLPDGRQFLLGQDEERFTIKLSSEDYAEIFPAKRCQACDQLLP